jgi:hypothetical protein
MSVRVAAVQAEPLLLDADATGENRDSHRLTSTAVRRHHDQHLPHNTKHNRRET